MIKVAAAVKSPVVEKISNNYRIINVKIIMNRSQKSFIVVAIFAGMSFNAHAQFQDFVNGAKKKIDGITNNKGGGSLSKGEITDGLKQALQVGAQNATGKVSAPNGFFGNALLKILMPPEARNVESKLREFGFGDQVDNAILTMNRGAEDASKKALPIFADAVKNITIEDGLSILKGNKDAATQYLKGKTSAALTQAFLPVIKESLDKVGATKYWADIFKIYNEIPFVDKVNTDLPGYVTQRALAGIFLCIADEEAKIRNNPEARVTDLLKKVFSN